MIISSLIYLCINRPTTAIELNTNKMYTIFMSALVVWSLLSIVIPYQQETLFLDAAQTTILSCSNGSVPGEMRCRQHYTIITSRDMQGQIRDKTITNVGYSWAQSSEWTCMNQLLFRPQLLGLGPMGRSIHMSWVARYTLRSIYGKTIQWQNPVYLASIKRSQIKGCVVCRNH